MALQNEYSDQVAYSYGRFLVAEALKNSNKFDDQNELKSLLIENYEIDYVGLVSVVRVLAYGINWNWSYTLIINFYSFKIIIHYRLILYLK